MGLGFRVLRCPFFPARFLGFWGSHFLEEAYSLLLNPKPTKNRLVSCSPQNHQPLYWVAVKELKLSYHNEYI